MGIATATIVGDLCEPAMAIALIKKSDQQAAAITEEDRSRVEVVPQKIH